MKITKVCKLCTREKFLWEFRGDINSKGGVKDLCKECSEDSKMLIKVNACQKRVLKKKIIKEKNLLREMEDKKRKEEKRLEWENTSEQRELLRKLKTKERDKIYKEKNRDKIKKQQKKRHNERLKRDSKYKLSIAIRRMIFNSFNEGGYRKKDNTEAILGCSFEELKVYLESKFENWMTWDNHGVYTGKLKETWQIDHIIAISTAKTLSDIIRLNHYTNLQPLDSYINHTIKRDKIIEGDMLEFIQKIYRENGV